MSQSPKASFKVSSRTGVISGSIKVGKRSASVKGYVVDGVGYGLLKYLKKYYTMEIR